MFLLSVRQTIEYVSKVLKIKSVTDRNGYYAKKDYNLVKDNIT